MIFSGKGLFSTIGDLSSAKQAVEGAKRKVVKAKIATGASLTSTKSASVISSRPATFLGSVGSHRLAGTVGIAKSIYGTDQIFNAWSSVGNSLYKAAEDIQAGSNNSSKQSPSYSSPLNKLSK